MPDIALCGIYGTLKGKITDEKGEGLIGASVEIIGKGLGAMADIDGNYAISNISPGKYDVKFSMLNYADKMIKVQILVDKITTLDMKLECSGDTTQTICCMASSVVDFSAQGSCATYTSDMIEIMPREGIKGVVGMTAGVSGGSVRGCRSSETQIRVDGLDVGAQFSPQSPNNYIPQVSPINQQIQVMSVGNGANTEGPISINSTMELSELLNNMQLLEEQKSEPNYRYDTENYEIIYENSFLSPLMSPLSTFSIDVDAAAYSNVRRYINSGYLPPKNAVRIEELINYFDYDYPQPESDLPFSFTTEVSSCPWNQNTKLVHIGLQGKKMETKELPPNNLVFLLDVSGSMNYPNKLPLVKSSIKLLVKQLRQSDKVSIVVYAGAAGLVLDATSGADKRKIYDALDALSAGGSTAGGAGIELAYKIAKENYIENGNNRVILATDGDFNVGISSDGELVDLIEEKRDDGIFLTVLGFGTGNYQDAKMQKLADKGNGNHAYIDNINEAKKVLVNEMNATLLTIAKDVKLQIEFNPAKVISYRLIGYENRILQAEDFDNDKKDAGELGAGHTVTALYEIVPHNSEVPQNRNEHLKYQTVGLNEEAYNSNELFTIKFRYKEPDSDTSKLIVKSIKDKTVDFDDSVG